MYGGREEGKYVGRQGGREVCREGVRERQREKGRREERQRNKGERKIRERERETFVSWWCPTACSSLLDGGFGLHSLIHTKWLLLQVSNLLHWDTKNAN